MQKNPQLIQQFDWINGLRYTLQICLLALVYYTVASIEMLLETEQRGAMLMRFPAGIALTALLLFGIRLWPGIVIGFLLFKSNVPLLFSSFGTIGVVLEAVVAAWLLRRFQFQNTFNRVYDVLLFGIVVLIISPLLGSSITSIGELLNNRIAYDFISQIWLTRWVGEGVGALVLTATLLVWRRLPAPALHTDLRLIEWSLMLVCLAVVSGLTLKAEHGNRLILLYMILPFAIWSAIRFQQHGATLATLLVGGVLLNGGLNRIIPGATSLVGSRDLLLEMGFIGITGFTSFLVAAAYIQQRQTQETLSKDKLHLFTAIYSIADAVITTDKQGRITFLNPVAELLTGWPSQQAITQLFSEVFCVKGVEPHNSVIDNPVERSLYGVVNLSRYYSLVKRDKREIAIECSSAPIRCPEGKIVGVILVFHDVSLEHKLHKQLSHEANHDALTGLYNRREFEFQLGNLVENAKSEGKTHSLLYLDLDQFKIVNDTCGHAAGDALLKQLVTVIQKRVRGGDIFARLGGDEFGILLKNCPIEQAGTVAHAFLNTVRNFRFVWKDKTFEVGVSIGAIPIDDHSYNVASVLSEADRACYAAKDSGRNRVYVSVRNNALPLVHHTERERVSHILKAVQDRQLLLYQQPIVTLQSEARHREVLLRMYDEDGMVILPGSFLPTAERHSLMPLIDRWVTHEVFSWLAKNPMSLATNSCIFINLSLATINDRRFIEFVLTELATLSFSPSSVCFEINEVVATSHLDRVMEFINELNKLGFRFAIDEFGSGVSAFSYLKQLSVNYLKIDGSLIKTLATDDPVDQAIVQSVANIARTLNIQTVALWVEDETTLMALHNIGVDFIQGFVIAKPTPFA